MKKIFKIEGTLVSQILSKDIKVFQLFTDYQNSDYINYDGLYISLTRLSYPNVDIEIFQNLPKPGQLVSSIDEIGDIEITSVAIPETIVHETDCINKGRSINNFTERSNLYTFILPTFSISGASKILSGLTIGSTNVYIVDTLNLLTFTSIFSGIYNDAFFINNNGIKFELFQRTTPTNISIGSPNDPYSINPTISDPIFSPNKIYGTDYYLRDDLENYSFGYSAITFSINLSNYEGEFLIKGLYKWKNFTYFSNLIGLEFYESVNGGDYPYYLYNSDRDYYFIYLEKALKPVLYSNVVSTNSLPLNILTFNPSFNDQVDFPISIGIETSITSIIVTVNGIVLSTSEYIISSSTLSITSGSLQTTDLINVIYSNQGNTPPIQTESYQITSINNTTYPTFGEKIIYNTDTNNYEYWLDYECSNQPIISVNGQILTNNIDFYVSLSNKKRIILEIIPVIGDIVTVFYNSIMNNGNNIISNTFTVDWTINKAPTNDLGYFITELTNYSDSSFTTPIFTGVTFYNKNQNIYNIDLTFTGGTYGDKYLLRVTNFKNYYTILGELLQTSNISEVIPLTITTNALNNY